MRPNLDKPPPFKNLKYQNKNRGKKNKTTNQNPFLLFIFFRLFLLLVYITKSNKNCCLVIVNLMLDVNYFETWTLIFSEFDFVFSIFWNIQLPSKLSKRYRISVTRT